MNIIRNGTSNLMAWSGPYPTSVRRVCQPTSPAGKQGSVRNPPADTGPIKLSGKNPVRASAEYFRWVRWWTEDAHNVSSRLAMPPSLPSEPGQWAARDKFGEGFNRPIFCPSSIPADRTNGSGPTLTSRLSCNGLMRSPHNAAKAGARPDEHGASLCE